MNRLGHQNYKNENTERKKLLVQWLISYIPELRKKRWVVLKTKLCLFKTNTTENYSKPTHVNNVYGGLKKPRKPKIEIIIKKQSS